MNEFRRRYVRYSRKDIVLSSRRHGKLVSLVRPVRDFKQPNTAQILPNEERDYWLLRSDRTCASSAIGSAAPCPRQVYAFTWLPPSFAVGTPETRSLFKQKMPR